MRVVPETQDTARDTYDSGPEVQTRAKPLSSNRQRAASKFLDDEAMCSDDSDDEADADDEPYEPNDKPASDVAEDEYGEMLETAAALRSLSDAEPDGDKREAGKAPEGAPATKKAKRNPSSPQPPTASKRKELGADLQLEILDLVSQVALNVSAVVANSTGPARR
ncbi:hypothetical protein WJX73_001065 [Symbiochloris irregularis]|uniref:Uncharacterized protein n=1 Tax=Symbiochloris irregularis TaxID=706552 RepID=A0AAW1NYE5_9CHLO